MAFSNTTFSQATFSGLGISPDVKIVPAGLVATGSVSSVAVALENFHPVFGNTATTTPGSVTVSAAANVLISLAAATGTVNNVSIIEGAGVDAALTLGAATSALGEEVITADANTSVVGLSATTGLGTVNQATIYKLTGVQASGIAGPVTVWGLVNTGQDQEPVYNDVDEDTTNTWSDINKPASNWNEVRL